ncbi:hypothetical protein KM915_20910 [Cytobacillus oceanisediminis]|uniref:hypothetical protein n=1 Tax=Cytobacillus oceanisediminis TaxID=665099 RepID=UPI001C24FBD9|nr:hypothetical protein [Cytobacillus oceanisediminis]MBU8732512.1 hypothetical protein [Cytobacillus oceanisediminis]
MRNNFDFYISSSSKNKMKRIKLTRKITYQDQTKSILKKYCSFPVEEIYKIIESNLNNLNNVNTNLLTINRLDIEKENAHLRKVFNALLTKLPRLEYREFIFLLIEDHFSS